jgi:hypothetical protein
MKKIAGIIIAAVFVLCLSPQTYAAAGQNGGQTELVLVYEASPTYTVTIIGLDASGSWNKGTTNGLTFICNGNFVKFTGLKLDGVLLDPARYTAISGSTIITFKPEYLDTLAVGKHTVELMFTDGSVETEFTILAAGSTTEPSDPSKPPTDPKDPNAPAPGTGDNSNMTWWFTLCGVSVFGLIMTFFAGRRRKCRVVKK